MGQTNYKIKCPAQGYNFTNPWYTDHDYIHKNVSLPSSEIDPVKIKLVSQVSEENYWTNGMGTTQSKIGRGNIGYVYDKFLLDRRLKNKIETKCTERN